MRAISSVVDVSVFLLLVTTAVLTLTLASDSPPERVAVDDRVELLGTVTTDLEYTVDGNRRNAHGTVAALLAHGAVANATIDGRALSGSHGPFETRVRNVTRWTLGSPNRTRVTARWVPYRGSPVRGHLSVGPMPPGGVDVSAATLSVPAPAPSVRERAVSGGQSDGFRGVAAVTASATTDTLLPESRAELPSGHASPASNVTSSRLRTLADRTDVGIEESLSNGNVSGAVDRVTRGLRDRFAADMRDRFETPADAAAAVRVGTVRITLRRWDG